MFANNFRVSHSNGILACRWRRLDSYCFTLQDLRSALLQLKEGSPTTPLHVSPNLMKVSDPHSRPPSTAFLLAWVRFLPEHCSRRVKVCDPSRTLIWKLRLARQKTPFAARGRR